MKILDDERGMKDASLATHIVVKPISSDAPIKVGHLQQCLRDRALSHVRPLL